MTADTDDSVQTLQHETQRLLGRCMLVLQQYERQLRAIVVHQEISGPINDLEGAINKRIATSARKTLGTMVGELLGSYLVNDDITKPATVATNSTEGGAALSMKIELGLSGADFARTKRGLKELVYLRNTLVHDFINQHDLQSVEGCRGANDELVAAYNRIERHFDELREWAEYIERARRQMLEEIREAMVNGIGVDGKEA